jgi:hypothetical protein
MRAGTPSRALVRIAITGIYLVRGILSTSSKPHGRVR